MITILDSGAANVRSLQNALNRLGITNQISADIDVLEQSDKIIFPGVGHATEVMKNLRDRGLDTWIKNTTKPFLGICLGMQVLFESSAEGDTPCLGIIPGKVVKFAPTKKVPLIGWNAIQSPLKRGNQKGVNNLLLTPNAYFYFVHSYFAPVSDYTIATSQYQDETFTAMVQKDNFLGTQFHPEKSGEAGERLLREFCS